MECAAEVCLIAGHSHQRLTTCALPTTLLFLPKVVHHRPMPRTANSGCSFAISESRLGERDALVSSTLFCQLRKSHGVRISRDPKSRALRVPAREYRVNSGCSELIRVSASAKVMLSSEANLWAASESLAESVLAQTRPLLDTRLCASVQTKDVPMGTSDARAKCSKA